MSENIYTFKHFSSEVLYVSKPEFLEQSLQVFNEFVKKIYEAPDDVYPVTMTALFNADPRIIELNKFIGVTAWDMLYQQGYDMEQYYTNVTELWGQQHYHMSGMDNHSHNTQISGFYFLEVPEDSSKLLFHDPRSVKNYAGLVERNRNELTPACESIYFEPKPGDMYFTNSWLSHSISRNRSKQPLKVIHFNVVAEEKTKYNTSTPIVI